MKKTQKRRGRLLEPEGQVPQDGLPWGEARHTPGTWRLLTADDPKAPNPAGFRGRLYPPQATMLHALIALERFPRLRLTSGFEGWFGGQTRSVQTRCVRIAEKFSFGKSVLTLALVCAQRVPGRYPELAPHLSYPAEPAAESGLNRAHGYIRTRGFEQRLPEFALHYDRFLPVTVVAAGPTIISQWESETRRFTDLRYLVVENVKTLRAFETEYRSGAFAERYDLIFVKIGRVTANFVVDGEVAAGGARTTRSMLGALARIIEGVPVARLVVDDFDVVKLCADDLLIPALFTILISATRHRTQTSVQAVFGQSSAEEFLRDNLYPSSVQIRGAALDETLNTVFRLSCDPQYVSEHINATTVEYRRIFVRGGRLAGALRDLDIADNIIEMLNADALDTAADALKLKANSVGELLRCVIGAKLAKYRAAVRAEACARECLSGAQAADEGQSGPQVVVEQDGPQAVDVEQGVEQDGVSDEKQKESVAKSVAPRTARPTTASFREQCKESVAAARATYARLLETGPRAAAAAAEAVIAWAQKEQEAHGTTLARMQSNIREGHCLCCKVPFESGEAAYVLSGCCQIVVCGMCVEHEGAFVKRCPNCARTISATRSGIVRVGGEIDLGAALESATVAEALEADAKEEELPLGEKLQALLQLVQGREISCLRAEATKPYVSGLLEGRRDVPPAGPPRTLVFTLYPESTRRIVGALTSGGVPHEVLCGTRSSKDEAVRRFRAGEVPVLVVTTADQCGGLDLPFVTDVVLYHVVLDKNLESQVVARGQRLGRTHNLRVTTLVNEAEASEL